jgi:hypothetical protein
MGIIDYSDWKQFWCKLKWQLISFKFLSFWAYTILLIFFWFSLEHLHQQSIMYAKEMFKEKLITSVQVSELINHSQTTLYDTALSHLLLFLGTIVTAILAIKGVSYVTEGQKERSVINKMSSESVEDKENLKKFLPKKGK